MSDHILGTLTFGGEQITLHESSYADGTPAILATDASGAPYATLSVNTGRPLAPRHLAIKTWSENEGLAEAARTSGLFEETAMTIPTGFVQAPVWRIRDEKVVA
jgi:hypothetical protein